MRGSRRSGHPWETASAPGTRAGPDGPSGDTRPVGGAPDTGGRDADGANGDMVGVGGPKEGAERPLQRRPSVRRGRAGDAHRNSRVVAAVGAVRPPVDGEDRRRLPFPDGMDNVGSFDKLDVPVRMFLGSPQWQKKMFSMSGLWLLSPGIVVLDRTYNEIALWRSETLPNWVNQSFLELFLSRPTAVP